MTLFLRKLLLRAPGALESLGLGSLVTATRLARGPQRGEHARTLLRQLGLPAATIVLACLAWAAVASNLKLGGLQVPSPAQTWDRFVEVGREWRDDRTARAVHEEAILQAIRENPEMSEAEVRDAMPYGGKRTFVDQLLLSLRTVFTGVGLAMLIAVPLGVLLGMSSWLYELANPLIQMFKPVSPLAWFPLVYIVVNKSVGADADGFLPAKTFIIAALVVTLCSLWPALINTANGVANVEKDWLNVARVLRLGRVQTVLRVVLPATLPAICTGARVSLGIGWMVLIASEMMAVSPGLGGFVWDWYQSSNDIALSYLVLAVIVIGIIGAVLDRGMIALQRLVASGPPAAIR